MRTRPVVFIVAAVFAVVAVGGAIVWAAYSTPRGTALLSAVPDLLNGLPKPEQRIGQIILDSYIEYRANTVRWSGVYFGCLFGSALCAALAAVVLKFEWLLTNEGFKKDAAALLSTISALLITLSTTGDFHQRWRANRLAAAKMEKLAYAFIAAERPVNITFFSAEIQAISYERNADIVADQKPSTPEKK